jgi:RHS repeat-associated protein
MLDAGQRAPRGTLNYAYDAANRLVAAAGGSAANAFAYDGDGNRVAQLAPKGTYNYVNDVATALPVVLSEQGPDGNITYGYGLGLIEEASSTFNYFYHYDGLGSAIALTDAAGKPQAAYAYDTWGNPLLNISDSVGTKNKFRFTGEALDPGTGLYYLRARYYDPSVGRFLSKDPFRRIHKLTHHVEPLWVRPEHSGASN